MIAKRDLFAFALVLLGIAGGGVRAASGDDDDFHYPLTTARMQAYFNAMLNLGEAACKDSKLAVIIERQSDAKTPTATVIAGYEGSPTAKQAFKAAGLTTQEFVHIGDAYTAAAFGLAYQQQTHGKLDTKVYDAANVEFFKAHQKELEAMLAKGTKEREAAGTSCNLD
jgi:hypothetical protein